MTTEQIEQYCKGCNHNFNCMPYAAMDHEAMGKCADGCMEAEEWDALTEEDRRNEADLNALEGMMGTEQS